jgi:hypothetical protein
MKKLFVISEDEKRRILNLHENAAKKQYLINEDIGPAAIATIDLKDTFKPGFYLTSQNLLNKLNSELQNLTNTLKKYQNQKLKIVIYAGESRLGNFDNEPRSQTRGKRLNEKELAIRRSNNIAKALKNLIEKQKKDGTLNLDIVFDNPQISLGQTKPLSGKRFSEHPIDMQKKFTDEQYVKVAIIATGEPANIPTTQTTPQTPNKNPLKWATYNVSSLFGTTSAGYGGKLIGHLHIETEKSRNNEYDKWNDEAQEDRSMFISLIDEKGRTAGQDILKVRYKLPDGVKGLQWWNNDRSTPGKSSLLDSDIKYMDQNFEKVDQSMYGKPFNQTGRGANTIS